MKLIEDEFAKAYKYNFKEVDLDGYSKKIVIISPENAAKAEFSMSNDSVYIYSSDVTAEPVKNGKKGSEAYWLTRLKEIVQKEDYNEDEYREIIENAVEAVDRENTTHLNADDCGRQEISERIIAFGKDKLVQCLKEGMDTLYNEIINPTNPDDFPHKKNKEYKPRINKSFASKFCHFACFYLFRDGDEQDNFSIYDDIVRKALPLYLKYYDLRAWDNYKEYRHIADELNDYRYYRESIDRIRDASGIQISRYSFDHLLWCYFRGRPVTRNCFTKN